MKLGPCLITALLAASFAVTTPAQKPPTLPRPVTIDDLFQVREVSDPQLSRDAQSIAYTVKLCF